MQQLISQRIADLYKGAGVRSFEPSQFVEQGLGSDEEVLLGFRELMDNGDLRGRALIRCAFGHDIWRGRAEQLRDYLTAACPKPNCDSHGLSSDEVDDDSSPYVIFRFDLTDRYLDAVSDVKKKTSM